MARHLYYRQWDNTNKTLKEICDKVYSYSKSYEIKRHIGDSDKLEVTTINSSNLINETLYEPGEHIEFVLMEK